MLNTSFFKFSSCYLNIAPKVIFGIKIKLAFNASCLVQPNDFNLTNLYGPPNFYLEYINLHSIYSWSQILNRLCIYAYWNLIMQLLWSCVLFCIWFQIIAMQLSLALHWACSKQPGTYQNFTFLSEMQLEMK